MPDAAYLGDLSQKVHGGQLTIVAALCEHECTSDHIIREYNDKQGFLLCQCRMLV